MADIMLSDRQQRAITDALRVLGYDQSLLRYDIPMDFRRDPSNLATIPLAAFWRKPFDQFTSAIGVRCISAEEPAEDCVKALGKSLWTPFNIIARPSECELWETFPSISNGDRKPKHLRTSTYEALASVYRGYQARLGPAPVGKSKERYRQMALFEVDGSPDAFFQWAILPTRKGLRRLLNGLLKELIPGDLDANLKVQHLRWLLRFIGLRISWDKNWVSAPSRTNADGLIEEARRYPTPAQFNNLTQIKDLAERFIESVRSVSFQVADGGLLSHLLQTHGLLDELSKDWKLYPTPPDLAWRMLETVPVEAIPAEKRLVWDGTCGTGTLLVAAMERLRQLDPNAPKIPSQMTRFLRGNDQQPLLTDITRLALDTALGAAEGPNWNIDSQNILNIEGGYFAQRPTIIVGNPPFEAKKTRPELAVQVINKYIEYLEPGGLLAVVLPRPLLGASSGGAKQLRKRLLSEFELYEVWELTQGFTHGASSEAAIICGRKRYAYETQRTAVVWRQFGSDKDDERKELFTEVVSSPDAWAESRTSAVESPLMLRLREALKNYPPLSDVIGRKRVAKGIEPGTKGRGDILSSLEPGSRPYVTGRTGMDPFYLPWRNRRWIRYNSSRLKRPRRESEHLFQGHKVLVARWSTGGNPWAVRAAVDEDGLYPSDDFIIVSPEPSLSCEFVAGIFNSALINCWIRLANPSRTIRVGECSTIPTPENMRQENREKIEGLARELSILRHKLADGLSEPEGIRQELKLSAKTWELDEAIYDTYEVSEELRVEIAEYFLKHDKPRPGFDSPMVKAREIELRLAEDVFGLAEKRRMRVLFETRDERGLTPEEADELDGLVASWEQAHLLTSKAVLRGKAS